MIKIGFGQNRWSKIKAWKYCRELLPHPLKNQPTGCFRAGSARTHGSVIILNSAALTVDVTRVKLCDRGCVNPAAK